MDDAGSLSAVIPLLPASRAGNQLSAGGEACSLDPCYHKALACTRLPRRGTTEQPAETNARLIDYYSAVHVPEHGLLSLSLDRQRSAA